VRVSFWSRLINAEILVRITLSGGTFSVEKLNEAGTVNKSMFLSPEAAGRKIYLGDTRGRGDWLHKPRIWNVRAT
jgi:hypothetical protein